MKRLTVLMLLITCPRFVDAETGGQMRTFLTNLDYLALAKQSWQKGDPITTQTVNRLIRKANYELNTEPLSVVFSPILAPTGDPHEYVSYGAYWWPNPDTPNGIPYVRRDGHINPDNDLDGANLRRLKNATVVLSLAYYFTGNEEYADKTAKLIRAWFLDEETYMNPRNEYGLIIPGVRDGYYDVAGFGNRLPGVFDAAGIIEASSAWSAEDATAMKQWARDLVHFGESTPLGAEQFEEPANHGTNFDFLQTFLSTYSEDFEIARDSVHHFLTNRFPGQVSADGSNPYEMTRANNLYYHRYNLERAMDLAAVGESIGIDAIDHETENGGSLRLQMDYLAPYFLGEKEWNNWPGEVFPKRTQYYYMLFRRAAIYFQEPLFLDAADSLGYKDYSWTNLWYPVTAVEEDLTGDFDTDGLLTVADVDLFTIRQADRRYFGRYDLNDDQQLNALDRDILVHNIFRTTYGDADLNGQFNTQDLIKVFVAAEYEDDIENNSTWATGDWNGDFEFDSTDLILAGQDGGYERSPQAAVPEPSAAAMIFLGLIGLLKIRRTNDFTRGSTQTES